MDVVNNLDFNIDMLSLHKMLFIYNAVINGWTVKLVSKNNFEFKSLINPWNIQDKYKANFDKIKCMEVTLEPGKIIFIPAYWWYSIKFEDNKYYQRFLTFLE